MKHYNYKRFKEEDSMDRRPTMIRKALNSSERQYAKREISDILEEVHLTTKERKKLIQDLRWDIEMKLVVDCAYKEAYGPENKLAETLKRIGFPEVYHLHKCTCIDPDNLSDEDVLKMSGY